MGYEKKMKNLILHKPYKFYCDWIKIEIKFSLRSFILITYEK